MADFVGADLRGSQFEHVELAGARLRSVDLSDARFHDVDLTGVVMRGVQLVNADIDGQIVNVTVNGVDIGPLINAELDRRYPDRSKMRPVDPAGFLLGLDTVQRLWGQTVARARELPPELLHEPVEGERSIIETLRHLLDATDNSVQRAHLGDPAPWRPISRPW